MGKIPTLRRLAEEYVDAPFILVAPHHQPGTVEQILAVCEKMKVNYTVTAQGDVEGQNTLSLPIAFLFDHRGKCVEMGRNISESAIAKAVKAAPAVTADTRKTAPHSILGDQEFEVLTAEAESIRARRDLGKTLAGLRAIVAADQDVAMDTRELEASTLLDSLEAHALERLEHATGLIETRASEAVAALEEFAKTWSGDELGDRAAGEAARLAGDEGFARCVRADGELQELELALRKLQPCARTQPLDLQGCAACRTRNAGGLRAVMRSYGTLEKKFGDTPQAQRGKDLLLAAGLAPK